MGDMSEERRKWQKEYSFRVASVSFLLMFIILVIAILFQGCASYPRTPAPIPRDGWPVMMVEDRTFEEGPDDAKKVEVSVGSLRKALIIDERYVDAVGQQNYAVKFLDEVNALYDLEVERTEDAIAVGWANSVTAFSIGLLGGVIITAVGVSIGR